MAFQYLKLKAKIVEKYGTQSKFAEAIGISEVALSKKMNCKISLSYDDIKQWSNLLGIEQAEIGEYFFA